MKVNKEAIVKEITEKIKTCEKYQAENPDPLAAKRVETLSQNPCQDGKFYVVLTYNKSKFVESDEIADRLKEIAYYSYVIPDWYMEEIFNTGCIIEYTLDTQKVKITKYDDYYELLKKLLKYYINENDILIKKFEPKESIRWFSNKNNFLAHDTDKYEDKYKKIIYSIASFNDLRVKLLNKKYNALTHDIYSIETDFLIPGYIDLNYKTAREKKTNLGVAGTQENVKILNEVTGYNQKPPEGEPVIHSSDKPKLYVYDIGNFFIRKIRDLEKSDKDYISKYFYNNKGKYEYPSDTSKYTVYNEIYGGSKDWKDWMTVFTQFNLFKKNSRKKEFLQVARANTVYIKNVEAYEKTSYLLRRNEKFIKYNYKDQSKIKLFGEGIKSVISSKAKLFDEKFIKCLGEPKTYVLKSKDDLFNFTKNDNTKNDIYVLLDVELPSATVGDFSIVSTEQEVSFLYNSDITYNEHRITIKGNNVDYNRPRDRVKLQGIEYIWYEKADLIVKEIDKTKLINEGKLYDGDLDSHYKRPENGVDLWDQSYVNVKNNLFFEGKDLLKKIFEVKIFYSLIPLTVTVEKKYEVRPQEGKQFGSAAKEVCDEIYDAIIEEEEEKEYEFYDELANEIEPLEEEKEEKAKEAYEKALKNGKTKKEAEEEKRKVEKEYDKKIDEIADAKEYQSEYKRICLDTLDYDPWTVLIDDLTKLLMAFQQLQADGNGEVGTPDEMPSTSGGGGGGGSSSSSSSSKVKKLEIKVAFKDFESISVIDPTATSTGSTSTERKITFSTKNTMLSERMVSGFVDVNFSKTQNGSVVNSKFASSEFQNITVTDGKATNAENNSSTDYKICQFTATNADLINIFNTNFVDATFSFEKEEKSDSSSGSSSGGGSGSGEDEKIKLCDKTFPLDFLGILKFTGMNSLLEKLGLLKVPAFITNVDGNKASMLDIAVALFNNAYRNDGLTVEQYIEKTKKNQFYQNIVTSLKYSELKASMNYYVDGSILSQFTCEEDLQKYQKELTELSKKFANKLGDLKNQFFARDVKVGIQNGTAFVPTGKQITWKFDILTMQFTIWGCDSITTSLLEYYAKDLSDDEYNEKIAELLELNKVHLSPSSPLAPAYLNIVKGSSGESSGNDTLDSAMGSLEDSIKMETSVNPWFLSEDAKKFLIYPYVPDPLTLLGLGGEPSSDGEDDEFENSYIYIPTSDSITDAIASIFTGKPIYIDFDIYTRKAIRCRLSKM